MDERMRLPRLHATTTETEALGGDLLTMRTIIDHHRETRNQEPRGTRRLQACVQVQLWVDDAGRESIVVLGDEGAASLQLKGLLHDGVYALAHQGEPGFIPPST